MSAPTRRTVTVTREIVATSMHCALNCPHLWREGEECDLVTDMGENLRKEDHAFIRTKGCLDGEIAARGGAL